jgi:pimeloyl-ACP methyl ester carboxylesterase
MAEKMRGVSIPQHGHLPHEEKPDIGNRELLAFLEGWNGSF